MHLARYFVQAVKRFPEAIAVVDEQVRWSYQNLYEEVWAVAANVQQLGVKQGDRVLVVLKNCRENLVLYWACQLLGLIYTPVNFRMSLAELAYCIGDAEPVLVFYEEESRSIIEAALKQAQSSARAYVVGANGVPARGTPTTSSAEGGYEQLQRRGASLQAVPPLSDDAIAIMLYTSGTTGRPKGVPRSHLNEASAAEAHIIQNQYTLFESTIGVMPFYHTMGMRTLLVTTFLNDMPVQQ
ncbi:MAG TPA: class I adenylate-forming enzyme family protein [Ktedonobacteraceae bacterium]|nr:class I adenylate-forming enzyme family protein [Ktedonobacteraceae bacterium]